MEHGSEGTKPRTNTSAKETISVIQTVQHGTMARIPIMAARTTPGSKTNSAEPTTVSLLRLRAILRNFVTHPTRGEPKHPESIIVPLRRITQITDGNQPLVAPLVATFGKSQNPKLRIVLIERVRPRGSGIRPSSNSVMDNQGTQHTRSRLATITRKLRPVRFICKAQSLIQATLLSHRTTTCLLHPSIIIPLIMQMMRKVNPLAPARAMKMNIRLGIE